MNELQKEFEDKCGVAHDCLNPELQNIGKVYSQKYTEWLEEQVYKLRAEQDRRKKKDDEDASYHWISS